VLVELLQSFESPRAESVDVGLASAMLGYKIVRVA
jgi:hypothetical protein